MAEYKARRARRRASGGKVGEGQAGPPQAGHMIIMIGLAKKPKKKAGGKVDGAAARKHLGKRARGGPPKRADGGAADDNMSDAAHAFSTVMDRAHDGPVKDHDAGMQSADIALDRMRKIGKQPTKYPSDQPEGYPAPVNPQRARGGRAPSDGPRVLDARDDAQETGQDGRDKVSQRSGTEERAVEMADPRKRGGGIHIKPSHAGRLHEDLGIPSGQKIPTAKLERAKEGASPAERKRITFAENARKWN